MAVFLDARDVERDGLPGGSLMPWWLPPMQRRIKVVERQSEVHLSMCYRCLLGVRGQRVKHISSAAPVATVDNFRMKLLS